MRLAAISLIGAALFLLPFTRVGPPAAGPALALALGTVAALMAVEHGTRRLDSRKLALLAALAAIDAALRLAVVTGIGGFSPIFFLVLCGGYVFGASFGFLLGATALLVSALVTGGIGPWLPYQVFATGWLGMFAGLVRRRAAVRVGRADVLRLALVGFIGGYGFGALMDLWEWTFFRGSPELGWIPGMPVSAAVARFGRFYLVTSLVYDSFRAVGNAVAVLALGAPVLAALARFGARFTVEVLPTIDSDRAGVDLPAAGGRRGRAAGP
jgi:energy-coupling factor transport system substrate-specific component